jgi:hypothetical protein
LEVPVPRTDISGTRKPEACAAEMPNVAVIAAARSVIFLFGWCISCYLPFDD